MRIQWDAKFSGVFTLRVGTVSDKDNGVEKKRITVFCHPQASRKDAVKEVVRQAGLHGYRFVTVDHIVKVGEGS